MSDSRFIRAEMTATTTASAKGSRLPADLLQQASNRLAVVGLACAALWIVTRFISVFVTGQAPQANPPLRQVMIGLAVLASLLLTFLARRRREQPARLLEIGLGFEILIAFLIAGMIHTAPVEMLDPVNGSLPNQGVSWVAVWVLIYSAVVPSTPWRTFFAAVIAVSLDPLWLYLAVALDRGFPSAWQTMVGYNGQIMPATRLLVGAYILNVVFAVLAAIPAKIISHLAKQVRRARLMGSYQLKEKLGEGGMGEVWRAEHRMLARPAAIKLVKPDVLGAKSHEDALMMLRRFEREAQATATLHSPHTIELYDFGHTSDSTFYYVMELLQGMDLDSLVRRFGPLQPERAVYLLRQACHSLHDAHANGMTHRDIKPANIFVCRMGQDYDFVKVLDFGLVKTSISDSDVALTADNVTSGTPAFMAPETALGEKNVDARVDIYALGCVGYWMLTGRLVFEGENPMQMVLQHVQTEPTPPSKWMESEIPRDLEQIILRCLAKLPADRPASASDLDLLLEQCAVSRGWTNALARQWWDKHDPETAKASAKPSQTAPPPGGSDADADSTLTRVLEKRLSEDSR